MSPELEALGDQILGVGVENCEECDVEAPLVRPRRDVDEVALEGEPGDLVDAFSPALMKSADVQGVRGVRHDERFVSPSGLGLLVDDHSLGPRDAAEAVDLDFARVELAKRVLAKVRPESVGEAAELREVLGEVHGRAVEERRGHRFGGRRFRRHGRRRHGDALQHLLRRAKRA